MPLCRLPVSAALASLSLLSACAGAPQRTAEADAVATASGPGATLVVQGLSCPLCATNVDKQLAAVDGVADVRVNLQTGEIEVDFTEGRSPSDEALSRAIVDSGFTLVRIVPRT